MWRLHIASLVGLLLIEAILAPTGRVLAAPALESPQPVSEAEAKRLSRERREDRRRLEGDRSAAEWSLEYLQFLWDAAQKQREIFSDRLRLAPSTRRGNARLGRPAAAPSPAQPTWVNLGPTHGGLEIDVTYANGARLANLAGHRGGERSRKCPVRHPPRPLSWRR